MYTEEVLSGTVVERIAYRSDGLRVNGYLARPKREGVFPLLIWNRGGSNDYGSLDDLTAYLILASTALWGYVVLATQYRGNRGSEGVEDWGGADVNDAINLIDVARELPYCDVDRIAIEGASRGGMTTYRALTMYDRFRCAITHAGLADTFEILKHRNDLGAFVFKKFGHLPDETRDEELARRSATRFADRLPRHTPILLMHGTADTVVPIEQSQLLVRELQRHHIPHKFIPIEGGQHIALKDGSYRIIDQHRREWLEIHMKL